MDHHRRLRTGAAEVVFCQGKADSHLCGILKIFMRTEETRAGDTGKPPGSMEMLHKKFPELRYDPWHWIVKRSLRRGSYGKCGGVYGRYGGYSVAEEAAQCAEFFGAGLLRYYDVGVAGIHRLLSKREEFAGRTGVIAIAGMEGALGSVLAGLVGQAGDCKCPHLSDTGANFGGVSARF